MPRSVVVGKVDIVKAGDVVAVDVEGRPIAVANVDGRLYAFDDTCTHEECSLAGGYLDGETITCPCHSAQFDVTNGEVVAPPAFEPVKTYPVRVEGGDIVLEI